LFPEDRRNVELDDPEQSLDEMANWLVQNGASGLEDRFDKDATKKADGDDKESDKQTTEQKKFTKGSHPGSAKQTSSEMVETSSKASHTMTAAEKKAQRRLPCYPDCEETGTEADSEPDSEAH